MANINKIRVSGQTYDIQDSNASKTVELTQAQYDALAVKDPNTYYIITDAQAGDLTQYWTSAQTQSAINQATSGKVNTSSVVSSVTSASTDSEIPTAKAVWEAASGGGSSINVVQTTGSSTTDVMSQDAVTSAIPTVPTSNTAFTNDAGYLTENDLKGVVQPMQQDIVNLETAVSGKVDTSAITTSVTSASTDSEIPTAKAVFDAIPSGGGSSYSAGTNISIDTANTISCTLNITNGSGVQSLNLGGQTDSKAEGMFAVAEGVGVSASSVASHAEGFQTLASGLASHAEGGSTKTINDYEHASGQFNVSNKANDTFGDSGNTLFSVGNGTADNERHNTFEIRQNGDIYLSSGGTDIKLQDHLGGGGGLDSDTERLLSTALVDLNDRKIDASEVKANYQMKGNYATKSELAAKANASEVMTLEKAKENELVTAAALNDLNERFGGLKIVKITESEYAALTTKDENTLYIVVADPS